MSPGFHTKIFQDRDSDGLFGSLKVDMFPTVASLVLAFLAQSIEDHKDQGIIDNISV